MSPLVSIVIPFFGKGTQELLHSVSTVVSRFPVEIIVVDDHSPVAPNAADLLPNPGIELTVIRMPENGGPGLARNVGLIAARGQFIAFLDADDGYDADYIDHAVQFLQTHDDCAMVFSPANYVCSAGQSLGTRAVSPEGYYVAGDLVTNKFLLQASVGRESVVRSMFFGPRYRGEDHEYVFRVASLGNLIRVSHGSKMSHRCGNGESLTRSNIRLDLAERLDVVDELWAHEASGDAYRRRLKGDRLLGLVALAIAEGNRELMALVVDVVRTQVGGVVFCPPVNLRALESLAQFFARKQFGRPLAMARNLTGSIAVAADFLGFCNDFCRPAFYQLIANWFSEARHPEAVLTLDGVLSDQIISEPRAAVGCEESQALIDEIHAKAGAPTLWLVGQSTRDASVLAGASQPPPLDGPQKFDMVYRSRVVVRPDGSYVAASHVARALHCASSLRTDSPRFGDDYFGGWRLCQ